MEVVDRHGWVEGMTIEAFGRHIGFRADKPGIVEQFVPRFPPGWSPSDRSEVRRLYSLRTGGMRGRRKRYHVLYMNASRFERSLDFDWVLERLESDVQLYVADRARYRIFVHAGVVGWRGRAILLPGRTMSGKTTLVTELLKLGATYYSDEYAVLSDAGRVYPFAKSLFERTGDPDDTPDRRDPADFGADIGEKPLPVGLVALTRYEPGAAFRPRRLTPGKAVLAMLENTVPARRRPRQSVRTLERVASTAPVVRGKRGDARAAAEALLSRLD